MEKFDLLPAKENDLNYEDIEGEVLMEDFLTKDIEVFQVNFFDKSEAELYVEDDIIFIIEAMQDFFLEEEFSNHYVFLGDGTVVIDTNLTNDKKVIVNLKISEDLSVNNLKEEVIKMPLKDYVLSWKNLVYQIVSKIDYSFNDIN